MIDDPREQLEKQFPEPNKAVQWLLQKATFMGEVGFALGGHSVLSILFKIARFFGDQYYGAEQKENMRLTAAALWDELERLGLLQTQFVTQKAMDDWGEALTIALRNEANALNPKPEWYVKVLVSAAQYGKEIPELTNFIRDLERLNDQDIAALKVLNRVTNPKGLFSQRHSGLEEPKRAEPTAFLHKRDVLDGELMMGVFGIDVHNFRQDYSREEIYVICMRLQGYGLAIMFESDSRTIPFGKFVCRPSKSGLMLLKLMGETVENWERWFDMPEQLIGTTGGEGVLKRGDRVRVKQGSDLSADVYIMGDIDLASNRAIAIADKPYQQEGHGTVSGPAYGEGCPFVRVK